MGQEGRKFKVVRLVKTAEGFAAFMHIAAVAVASLPTIYAAVHGDYGLAMIGGGLSTINASLGTLRILEGLEKITAQNDEVKEQVEEGKTK